MNETQLNRKRLLLALLDHAEKSDNFHPHFYKKDMMDGLGVTEREFNIIQKNLGDKYCHFVDLYQGVPRYAINVSECLALYEQYVQESIQKSINQKRNQQLVRPAIFVAILGTVLGAALSFWFSK